MDKIYELLSDIPDPEIPVLSILDLGIVRHIKREKSKLIVTITPTYSGCPAMKMIEDEIINKLKSVGEDPVIRTIYSPAWTTDWMSDSAKEKLRVYGIAPPIKSTMDKNVLIGKSKNIKCPRCSATNVEMVSQFGSTACKALYRCKECLEPFDYFKCI